MLKLFSSSLFHLISFNLNAHLKPNFILGSYKTYIVQGARQIVLSWGSEMDSTPSDQ